MKKVGFSATPKDEIIKIIEKRNMSRFFNKIYGSPEGKISIVEKIINENYLLRDETIFLGDALSDYNAATENDIDFALRKTTENKRLFYKKTNLIRFLDFYELDKQINN